MNLPVRHFAALLVASVCLAAPALASEAAEGHAQSPETTPLGWLLRGINFIVLAGGLGYLMRGAPGFFRTRAQRIVAAITDARRVKEDALEQLRDAEAKLARLPQQIEALRVSAKQDGLAEAERIRLLAQEESAKIERAAQMEIDAAERAARMELKAMAAQMAIERAEAIVKGRITPEAQAALVRAFVENLGRAS